MFNLNKEKNKDFKILQITDIQIIDPNQRCYDERLSKESILRYQDINECVFNKLKKLIEDVKPDYIISTGDNVYGEFDLSGEMFKKFVEFMDSFNIPWSFINGNHDGETDIEYNSIMYHCGIGMKWQGEYATKNTKNLLFELGDEKMGYGNYTVTLLEDGKPLYNFIFMDTHGARGIEEAGINECQMKWYKEKILENKMADSLLFIHIPLFEYMEAAIKYYGSELCFISDGTKKNERGDFGQNLEKLCVFDSHNFFSLMKELGSTKYVFCGHDHVNNSSILYDGIRLTYGMKMGIYDYHKMQGGTLITINENGIDINQIIID